VILFNFSFSNYSPMPAKRKTKTNQQASLPDPSARLVRDSAFNDMALQTTIPQTQIPHPIIFACRKALAKRPPAPLGRILNQIKEAQEWMTKHSSAHRLKRRVP
jgi:hypothetical protein